MLFYYKKQCYNFAKICFFSTFPPYIKTLFINAVLIMKKVIQGALLPFVIFSAGVLLIGCEQNQLPETTSDKGETEQSLDASSNNEAPENLKSGNMLYIVRDVADMQMKAGEYIEQLKQTQTDLESAVNAQNHEQLQTAATQLQTQLKELNQVLESLNLKSQEIDGIRANILSANEKVLNSSFLNGDLDLSKVDLEKIEQQMGSVQDEMIKLASMMISSNDKESS